MTIPFEVKSDSPEADSQLVQLLPRERLPERGNVPIIQTHFGASLYGRMRK